MWRRQEKNQPGCSFIPPLLLIRKVRSHLYNIGVAGSSFSCYDRFSACARLSNFPSESISEHNVAEPFTKSLLFSQISFKSDLMGEISKYFLRCVRLDYSFNGMSFFAWQNLFWHCSLQSTLIQIHMYCEKMAQVDKNCRKVNPKGTSINDIQHFSAIFDLPTYHVQRFLPYNVWYLGAFLDPPTYPKIGRLSRSAYTNNQYESRIFTMSFLFIYFLSKSF